MVPSCNCAAFGVKQGWAHDHLLVGSLCGTSGKKLILAGYVILDRPSKGIIADISLFASTMFFTSFTAYYRLVYALSLLQIASSVATLALYGADGYVVFTVVTPTAYAFCTAVMMHRMLSYARRPDPNHPHSRVKGQYYMLIYTVGMWVLCILVLFYYTTYRSALLSTALAICAPWKFFANMKCVPLGMDTVLPFAILTTVHSASRALRRQAVELHGMDIVVAPLVPVAQSASESAAAATDPKKFIPAWMAPHVADLARDVDSDKSRAIVQTV